MEKRELIDAFICGYIDGDGSIGLYKKGDYRYLRISMLGTKSVCTWIQQRFSEMLLKTNIGSIYQNNKYNKSTFCYAVGNKIAESIYKHFYEINVPKLVRK